MSIPFNTKQFEEKSSRKLPRSKVRLDNLIASQTKLDPTKVANIARQAPEKITTDPIVSRHKGKYVVLDGHHRVAGAMERGDRYIKVKRIT